MQIFIKSHLKMFELNNIQIFMSHCIYETFVLKREICAFLLTRKKVIHRKYLEDIEKIQKGIRFLSSARLPFSEAVLYRTKIGHRGDVLSKSFWNDVFPFVMRNTAAGKKKEFTRDLTFNFPLMAISVFFLLLDSQFNQNKTK